MKPTPGQLAYEAYAKEQPDERLAAWDSLAAACQAKWENVAIAAAAYWVGGTAGVRDNGTRKVGVVASIDSLGVNVTVY